MSLLEKLQVRQEDGVNQVTSLRNKDIIPMGPQRRIWHYWSYVFYWGISNICISAWSGAASMLSLGLSVGETMGTIIVGNVIIATLALLNAAPGGDYHVGFTICQRFVFGIRGSYLGLLIRIILSIVWFGSQSWLGGLCLGAMISSWSKAYMNMTNTFPESVAMTKRDCISFLIYQLISLPMFYMKPERINKMLILSSITTFFAMVGITVLAVKSNGGNGPLMKQGSDFESTSAHAWAWIYGTTSWYGSLSAAITNQSDYTRFSYQTWSSLPGTLISVVVVGTFVPLMGTVSASACEGLYGEAYWMPNDIIMKWLEDDYTAKARAGAFFASVSFLLCQLSFNAIGNGFAGGMDFAGLFPKYFNIRRASIVTALLSWCVTPWNFYVSNGATFVNVMSSFSLFMSPIIGLIISEYWVIRRRNLKLSDLYTDDSAGNYWYTKGVNFRTSIIWLAVATPAIPGLAATVNPNIHVNEGIINYYYGNCIFGFCIAFTLNLIATKIWKPKNPFENDEIDYFDTFTPAECERLGLVTYSSFVQGLQEDLMMDDFGSVNIEHEQDLSASTISDKCTYI